MPSSARMQNTKLPTMSTRGIFRGLRAIVRVLSLVLNLPIGLEVLLLTLGKRHFCASCQETAVISPSRLPPSLPPPCPLLEHIKRFFKSITFLHL